MTAVGRNEERLETASLEIAAVSGRRSTVKGDVRNYEEVERAVQATAEHWRDGRNATVGGGTSQIQRQLIARELGL